MKIMFIPVLAVAVGLFSVSHADVEVMFHPKDPTLVKIADWIEHAQKVDIAMYNMDFTDGSPVIQKLKTPEVQSRLKSGQLQIRIIFEGYGTRTQSSEKLKLLEDLGLDARYLGKEVKIHHKFAVIDTGKPFQKLVTGSANWSLSSHNNYNENILFFTNEPEMNFRFQTEFNRLWKKSRPFGNDLQIADVIPDQHDQIGLEVYFNSPRLLKTETGEPTMLQDQVIRLIRSAQKEVLIASTRIRLESILSEIRASADRGVSFKIIINQDDYKDLHQRSQWLMDHPNIHLRVKFFNLKVSNYLTYQMHNKMMIADRNRLLTGSFNWSFSSENSHIENLIQIDRDQWPKILDSYVAESLELFELGRPELPNLLKELAQTKAQGQKPPCAFSPTALEVSEIRFMISEYRSCLSEN